MRNRLCAICALLTLAMSSLAPAAYSATIWTGTNYQIDASAPTPVGTALFGVTLTAVGLNGATPNGFDGVGGGLTGFTTVGNSLHQVWEFAALVGSQTPTLALNNAGNAVDYPIDSHFLVDPPSILPVLAPIENQLVADATEDPFAGYGNSLTGEFVLSGLPAASWDFAYLALPGGTSVDLNFLIAAPGFNSELVQMSFMVPEPSSVCLFAIGALGFAYFVRRRRAGSALGRSPRP